MTEKAESFEIHPMLGHSRGEWYGSLDDIAESDEEAEYWAVFGVTHRGNRHCLGEFPTKAAATAATQSLRYFPHTARPKPKDPSGARHIVQLEVKPDSHDSSMVELFALCNDGTVWHRGIGVRGNRGFMDESWEEISLDGLEPD